MAIESNHDTKHVKLSWNVETKVVRITCTDLGLASKHLSRLIELKLVGTVDGIILTEPGDHINVKILRGKHIVDFLRLANEVKSYKPKTKFTDILRKKSEENDD